MKTTGNCHTETVFIILDQLNRLILMMIRELHQTIFQASQPLIQIIQREDITINPCLMRLSQRLIMRYHTLGLIFMVKKRRTCCGKVSMNNRHIWQRLDRIMLQVNTITMMITIQCKSNTELEMFQVLQTVQE